MAQLAVSSILFKSFSLKLPHSTGSLSRTRTFQRLSVLRPEFIHVTVIRSPFVSGRTFRDPQLVDFPFPSSLPFQPERHDRADHLALAHPRKARGGALKVYGYE